MTCHPNPAAEGADRLSGDVVAPPCLPIGVQEADIDKLFEISGGRAVFDATLLCVAGTLYAVSERRVNERIVRPIRDAQGLADLEQLPTDDLDLFKAATHGLRL